MVSIIELIIENQPIFILQFPSVLFGQWKEKMLIYHAI